MKELKFLYVEAAGKLHVNDVHCFIPVWLFIEPQKLHVYIGTGFIAFETLNNLECLFLFLLVNHPTLHGAKQSELNKFQIIWRLSLLAHQLIGLFLFPLYVTRLQYGVLHAKDHHTLIIWT